MILFITLFLAFAANSQDAPDLSKYDPIGVSGGNGYLVRKDIKRDGDRVDFILMIARLVEDVTDKVILDGDNWTEANLLADCKKKTYQRIRARGIKEGTKFESKEKSEVIVAEPGTRGFQVLEFVCKPSGLLTD